jgi:hypothetical protein
VFTKSAKEARCEISSTLAQTKQRQRTCKQRILGEPCTDLVRQSTDVLLLLQMMAMPLHDLLKGCESLMEKASECTLNEAALLKRAQSWRRAASQAAAD